MKNRTILKVISGTVLCSMIGYTLPAFGYTKDETVYSKLDASGSNYKTIVSTHIQNTENEDLISDLSDLLNVKNTSGDETYIQDGSIFKWNANKNDIYYQGESEKELPIQCNIKYELDGEEKTAQEIVGKSGKVKITLQYTNKEERTVDINGKKVKMYVPFVVVAGTIVNNENNKNIEVSNGKVVNDGTKTVIVGMAMPGLQESLGVSEDEIEIPSNIEITMDATDFESNSIMSYVTPKVLEKDDLKVFNKLDDVYSKVSTLQSSSNQILDGANTLKDATSQLAIGANTLNDGVKTAYTGAEQIKAEVNKSTNALKSDTSDALDAKTLAGIKAQATASAVLTEAQKTAITKQATASAVLTEAQKTAITKQATAGSVLTEIQKATITKQATASAVLTEEQKVAITKQATASAILTDKQKAEILSGAEAAIAPAKLTEVEKALLISTAQSTATATAVTTALQTAQSTATTTAVTTALQTAQSTATTTAVTTALQTAQSIATTTAQATALQTAQTTATTTAQTTATTTAKQVGNQAKQTFTKQVVSQMSTLSNGLNQLTSGLSQLSEGSNTLSNGSEQINDGAKTLADGIKTFNEEGISKICNYINGDAKNLATRVEKLTELSKDYNNFTMLDDGNKGEVKFIMVIDAVKKQEESEQNKEEAVLNTNIINEQK